MTSHHAPLLPGLLLLFLAGLPCRLDAGFVGLDRNGDLVCEPGEMGFWIHGSGGTDSTRPFFEIPGSAVSWGCTFCVQDRSVLSNESFVYATPGGWAAAPMRNSDDFPGLSVSAWIKDRFPAHKCFFVQATAGDASRPQAFPGVLGTFRFDFAPGADSCLGFLIDGANCGYLSPGGETGSFGDEETCRPYRCSLARRWYIQSDGMGDAPTIQAGIDSAAPGDTLLLGAGTFTGPGNRDIRFGGKAVVVRGKNAPEFQVLSCTGEDKELHRGFIFDSGEGPGSVVSSLTVANGNVAGFGGGILCVNGSSPTLVDVIFQDNHAETRGGGTYSHASSPTFLRCTFRGNSSRWGGGISARRSALTLETVLFQDNSAGPGEYDAGGGIACDSSSLWLNDVRFEGNSAPFGGGLWAYISTLHLTNCEFVRNTASFMCGALFTDPILSDYPVTLENCSFLENEAVLMGGAMGTAGGCDTLTGCSFTGNVANYGGALYLGGGPALFEECSFQANFARRNGGVVYECAGLIDFTNCTFTSNTAADSGGVMHGTCAFGFRFDRCTISHNSAPRGGAISLPVASGWSVDLTRCIVAFSDSSEAILCNGPPDRPVLACCDLYGNAGGDWVGCIAPQAGLNGNFSADPLFCDSEADNFRLDGESPCLDAPGCGVVGAWQWGCGEPITGIAEPGSGFPTAPYLEQNVPNPFNPATTIRFGLPEPGQVRVTIHDVSGRIVRVLADEPRAAGAYDVTWDGRDQTGRAVGSGIYLVRMKAKGFQSVKKMTVLR